MLWGPVRQRQDVLIERGASPADALRQAAGEVLSRQSAYTSVPRRFSGPMREIWNLQRRFARRKGKTAFRLATHERFRAAYDFLLLRTEAGELGPDLAHWWTEFQEQSDAGRQEMVSRLSGAQDKKGRKRRRRGKK
jgi:poly(A) polymerase